MGTKDCNQISAMASPSKGEAGKTGQWRTQRPVIDHSKCIPEKNRAPGCFHCWLYCPEAVIEKKIPIEIDLTYCKGCGICAEECASGAITMAPESEAAKSGETPHSLSSHDKLYGDSK